VLIDTDRRRESHFIADPFQYLHDIGAAECVSAWKKDPVIGVIGVQSGALPHRKCYRIIPPMTGVALPNQVGGANGERNQHGRKARGVGRGGGRYRAAGRVEKGRILDELTATTGWHRKHAVRALSVAGRDRPRAPLDEGAAGPIEPATSRPRKYAGVRDALIALWEASDRVCGKRLVSMIPVLLSALERHGRLKPTSAERALLATVSAATIDRILIDVKVAAAGGRRRQVGFYSAIRREVPIRTFNDWANPPPGFCEIDMVAHGGTSVAGLFIQTLTMVDIATRMDGMLAPADTRWQPCRRSNDARAESFPVGDLWRRLR
jgi:hypothetical protein